MDYLICSASAFHWIPKDIGYIKVFEMLKSGIDQLIIDGWFSSVPEEPVEI